MAPKTRSKIPKFESEEQESAFWDKNDSTDFIDWSKGKVRVFPELKPSVKTISLRLPESLLAGLKVLANKRDIPYQSLLKIFLAERIEKEMKGGSNK
jgi:predicted DNA binding CopG/RHH family protein